ncbi:MAG: hypothetical protein H6625_04530 [Bdellovibrionaceae bacterium]|nr:hypothetical protein [Pseudobdellovibrionaceae bacterium]
MSKNENFFSQDFEREYFDYYFFNEKTQTFEDYSSSWSQLSYIPQLVKEVSILPQKISTVLVLGAGSGEALNYLNLNNFKSKGIEISQHAKERCLKEVSRNILWGSITKVYPEIYNQGQTFHLIFSSCLQYLNTTQINSLLPLIKNSCHFFSHFGGFKGFGENELDPKLKTLQPYKWWTELFLSYGFIATHSPYLWKTYSEQTQDNLVNTD